ERREECVNRLCQHAPELAYWRDDTVIRLAIEAFHERGLGFSRTHYRTDIDALRGKCELEATAAAAHVGEETRLSEVVNDLGKVACGNPIRGRHFRDRRACTWPDGQVHQYAQTVVGEAGQAHGLSVPRR